MAGKVWVSDDDKQWSELITQHSDDVWWDSFHDTIHSLPPSARNSDIFIWDRNWSILQNILSISHTNSVEHYLVKRCEWFSILNPISTLFQSWILVQKVKTLELCDSDLVEYISSLSMNHSRYNTVNNFLNYLWQCSDLDISSRDMNWGAA